MLVDVLFMCVHSMRAGHDKCRLSLADVHVYAHMLRPILGLHEALYSVAPILT